jgi:hypothetical protein
MKITKIVITVNLGNDAMQSEIELAAALRNTARRIEQNGLEKVTKVMDVNGNSVGTVECE